MQIFPRCFAVKCLHIARKLALPLPDAFSEGAIKPQFGFRTVAMFTAAQADTLSVPFALVPKPPSATGSSSSRALGGLFLRRDVSLLL